MATSNSKKRAQGGGRTANSEPRIQMFKEFAGCNFQLSPRSFTLGKYDGDEQSDLQMNYVVIQNNAQITDNKTIETRANIVKLFDVPENRELTGTNILVNNELYAALDNGHIAYWELGNQTAKYVTLDDKAEKGTGKWLDFEYINDELIGLTDKNIMWSGKIKDHILENAPKIEKPETLVFKNLDANGKLEISEKINKTNKITNRIVLAYAYVNKYGPTEVSDNLTFYANKAFGNWSSEAYLTISHSVPKEVKGLKAVEFFFATGNSSSLQPAGRIDLNDDATEWSFNLYGYLDITSMWPLENMIPPNKNYTQGVHASRMTCIDSRMYFWGDEGNMYRLWIGGNPGNLLSTSIGTGGGFVDVEPGSGQEIRYVCKYKTQSGNSIPTMLCDSKNSTREQRYNLVENSLAISNEQSMKSWQAEQVAGAVGCKSYNGAVVCEDGLYSVSRYGLALTTMTMEYNSQIRANYVSNQIKPVFTDKDGSLLKNAMLLEADGVLYLCFGNGTGELDNILFCYDIDLKSWWTYSFDLDEPILNLMHIDYEGYQEGIGITTKKGIYLLPLTKDDGVDTPADFDVLIQTGELSTTQPQQNWFYLSQMEFKFDYFVGKMKIELIGIDQFGRRINTTKTIEHQEVACNLSEFMRVDLRLQSYQIRITGKCKFRLTHFMSKVYTISSKQGLVWGFNDSQSFRHDGDIHPTFKDYNDIRKAIIV